MHIIVDYHSTEETSVSDRIWWFMMFKEYLKWYIDIVYNFSNKNKIQKLKEPFSSLTQDKAWSLERILIDLNDKDLKLQNSSINYQRSNNTSRGKQRKLFVHQREFFLNRTILWTMNACNYDTFRLI